LNKTKSLIDNYKSYVKNNKTLSGAGSNESTWGNVESHYSDLLFLNSIYQKGYSFLDIGSGAGQILMFAKQIGYNVKGIEFNKAFKDVCDKNGLDVVYEDLMSINLDFIKNFDVIYYYRLFKKDVDNNKSLSHIVKNMKVGAIIKVKLTKFDFENFIETSNGTHKKIK